MIEGRVYLCSWSRVLGGYRVWLQSDPTVAAEHADFEEADRRLWEVIGLATGDGENVHEYVPPAPTQASAGAAQRGTLWDFGIQSRVEMVDPAGLFAGGLCTNCLMPRGPRTELPLAVTKIDRGVHASRVSLPRTSPGVGPVLSVFSSTFLDQLTQNERNGIEWRPIVPSKGEKRTFFELVPRATPVPMVGEKGFETYYGLCETCGSKWVVPNYVKGRPFSFVSEAELPHPVPSVLTVDRWAKPSLAASEGRWLELVGTPAMKGIKGGVIGIIAEDAVDSAPSYKPRPAENRAATAPASWFGQ
jgi:hypothetical protein